MNTVSTSRTNGSTSAHGIPRAPGNARVLPLKNRSPRSRAWHRFGPPTCGRSGRTIRANYPGELPGWRLERPCIPGRHGHLRHLLHTIPRPPIKPGMERRQRPRVRRRPTQFISPAAMLTVNATITVLNKNPISPCTDASRRSLRDVISTSETWNVIPSTSAKYTKSQ